ncbi:MAG TPA: 5'-3' exonuclease H3TH domain-containing protein [Pyrinomonadaceae bacterium]|nr:5'-3' exonuclease H3TH domain-containing protein [Pyrinomonadaceae bacterium]
MIVHLIDGTYELFRHFYGIRRFKKIDPPFGAVSGVLNMVAKMIEDGATHLGVATDHVIESFRNDLWAGYKTGAGIERALLAQFHPLEEALAAMGVTTWAMVEYEADDALAAAAHLAAEHDEVEKVCIWTPDKDLAQCVVDDRVVQIDRRKNEIRDENAIRTKFGVSPEFIPDYLALVGDAADGYPGISGLGAKTAATLINRYGHIEEFPAEVISGKRPATKKGLSNRELALLFKNLATLRTDIALFDDVDELRWRGSAQSFPAVTAKIGDSKLLARVEKLKAKLR